MVMEKMEIDWEKERDNASKMGLIMGIYLDRALTYIERTNPFQAIVDKLPEEKARKNVELDTSSIKSQVQTSVNDWLETFSNVLKEGRSLPVDLIGRAAELAKQLREHEEERRTPGA